MHAIETIPDGRAGLAVKVRRIRELVEQAKRDPAFRARAAAIVRDVEQRDQEGEIAAVFDFVRDHVRYLRDPWSSGGLELFTTPRRLLEDIDRGEAAGDCDDHVILASALLETIGYRTRYRIGGVPPDHFRHIWLEVQTATRWMPLELTKKDEPIDFDPSSRFPLRLTLTGEERTNMQGGLGASPAVGFDLSKIRRGTSGERRANAAARQATEAQNRRAALYASIDPRRNLAAEKATSMQASESTTSGRLSRWDQFDQRTREKMQRMPIASKGGALHGMTPQEERWNASDARFADEATTDVWPDRDMLGDLAGSLTKKLKKLNRVLSPTAAIMHQQKKKKQKKAARAAAADAVAPETPLEPTPAPPQQMFQPLPFTASAAAGGGSFDPSAAFASSGPVAEGNPAEGGAAPGASVMRWALPAGIAVAGVLVLVLVMRRKR